MPLLEFSTPQSSFRNNLYSIGFHHAPFISGNQKTANWRYLRLPHNPNTIHINPAAGRLMINAVATLEPRCSDKQTDNAQKLTIHSGTDLPATDNEPLIHDEKELLRRKRISKANKGKEAWNKGVKHSPETRQKIRERTRIAMRSPKVKMKLLKAIHSQSPETRLKIAAAVKLTWDRRRNNRRMVARCHREWLNLIAEASRKGLCGEEELQWDSYKIITQQLEKEFQDGIESRKKKGSPVPGNRAPKTLEQRKKISDAIAAKWADPAYRDRVYSGMAKRRGKGSGSRAPEWGKKKEPKPVKKREGLDGSKMKSARPKLKTSIQKEPQARFKDPQARYKLEMIKSIRAQRAASHPNISEAVLRANVLIGEAQRAAEALEVAAAKSPMAEASLVETRKLIAEAISYIKSITVNAESPESSCEKVEDMKKIEERGVNGVESVGLKDAEIDLRKVSMKDEDGVANGSEHIDLSSSTSSSSSSSSSWGDLGLQAKRVEVDGGKKMTTEKEERRGSKGRRWVCGRLVEDEEED